ncbi:MAG TPA: YCF48-related protein [Gammaproteobacteria bacterium]
MTAGVDSRFCTQLEEYCMGMMRVWFRSCGVSAAVVAVAVTAGCHGGGEWEPLTEQKIYVSDKFFDVAVLDPQRAIIIGYGGKIIETTDGGFTWSQIPSGTQKALFSIDFTADGRTGWIVGEEGLVLKTTDAGKSWKAQEAVVWLDSECNDEEERRFRELDRPCQFAYLFALSVIDENNVAFIGDKSIYGRTRDGGATWEVETLKFDEPGIDPDMLLAFEDPVLYDVEFIDQQRGYIVGEFGKIYHTKDGGESWEQQQESMMDETVFDVLDLPTMFDVEFNGPNNGIAVGLDGRIAVTSDGGKDWNFAESNVKEYIDPFYAATILDDGTRWVVGASGQVVVSRDGQEFERGDLGSAVNNWMRRVRFVDDKNGWLVGGFGFVMSTDDGGKTWYRRIG